MHTACCNAASTYAVWLYTVEGPMATVVWNTAHENSQKWPALGIECHSLRCGEWHFALLLHPACNTLPQFEPSTFLYTLPARQLVSSCLGYQMHGYTVLRYHTCQMHIWGPGHPPGVLEWMSEDKQGLLAWAAIKSRVTHCSCCD